MNPTPAPSVVRPPAKRLWFQGILAVLLLLPVVIAVAVVSCFHLSSDTRALRNSLIKSSGVKWRQKIALNAGGLTLSAVRAGLSFVNLDAGARAVLQAVRGAEVGIYQLPSGAKPPDGAAMLVAADAAMTARGWDRVVGVLDGGDLVTVYVPDKTASARRMKCCLMVFDGQEMVVVSARANLEPLLKYALAQPAIAARVRSLVRR
jgi:hypothetical protein